MSAKQQRETRRYVESGPQGRTFMERSTMSSTIALAIVLAPFTLGISLVLPFMARKRVNEWRRAARV